MTLAIVFPGFTLALLLAGAAWLLSRRRTRSADPARQRDALQFCDGLLHLLALLQQHRGLSSAWLAGDRAFESRMLERRRDIDALFVDLAPFAERESTALRPCLTSNDLTLFRFRFRALVEALERGSVEQNIALHSHLIERLLDWLADLGEARIELASAGGLAPGLVRNYAHRLPALSECLGQARAIGSGVAAQQGCPAVARVRLMFLVARAEALLERAAAADDTGPAGMQATAAVGHMAQTIRLHLLATNGVTLGTDEYFTLATRAVDAVIAWTRASGARIDAGLDAPRRPLAAQGG